MKVKIGEIPPDVSFMCNFLTPFINFSPHFLYLFSSIPGHDESSRSRQIHSQVLQMEEIQYEGQKLGAVRIPLW